MLTVQLLLMAAFKIFLSGKVLDCKLSSNTSCKFFRCLVVIVVKNELHLGYIWNLKLINQECFHGI